jgi:hypothetical protein
VIAWSIGALVGLAQVLGVALGWSTAYGPLPAALWAYLASLIAFLELTSFGFKPRGTFCRIGDQPVPSFRHRPGSSVPKADSPGVN